MLVVEDRRLYPSARYRYPDISRMQVHELRILLVGPESNREYSGMNLAWNVLYSTRGSTGTTCYRQEVIENTSGKFVARTDF